jgi:hypothetical protein
MERNIQSYYTAFNELYLTTFLSCQGHPLLPLHAHVVILSSTYRPFTVKKEGYRCSVQWGHLYEATFTGGGIKSSVLDWAVELLHKVEVK